MDAQDRELDDALARLRDRPAVATPAFMAELLEQALRAQPRPVAAGAGGASSADAPPPFVIARLWGLLVAGLGGRAVMAGLCGAAVLGLCIGYVGPEGLQANTIDISDVGYELVPAAELFLTEI